MSAGPDAPPQDGSNHAAILAEAERVLAVEIRDFIQEMCLLDGGVLIGWVRGERHGNIAELVASSAEPFFKEATLTYADAADVLFDWGRSMQVVLDLEFAAAPVTVFFKLVLDGMFVGVTIERILAERDPGPGPAFCLDGFTAALGQARIARPSA